MIYKSVMAYSKDEGIYRLCRLMWTVGTVGDGKGYSCKLSFAVSKMWPFIRIKLHTSYGGIYA